MMKRSRQAGFTLTELMISTALSLSVISSILVGYLATLTSSANTLDASKLNQELTTLMSVMVSDIRRAGYWANALNVAPTANIFSAVNNTALEVFDNMTANNQVAATGSGSCIVYAYDADEDGAVDAEELMGFRLNGSVVQMRTSGNLADPDSCASASNTWVSLTDSTLVNITTLDFDLTDSICLNTREPDGVDNDGDSTIDNAEEADCYAQVPTAGSGDITVETRQLSITLAGTLADDAFVRLSLTQDVRVRNDIVREY
ncbi:MAG: prepilin-type N-terminal cleavage/methylation domain-containing protein [Pseudohongiellaceae bacterium]